jgi:hypothetical protein
MSFFSWLRPKQQAEKDAANHSEERLDEKIQEVRNATSRVVKQTRVESRKAEEVLHVAEEALRKIRRVTDG